MENRGDISDVLLRIAEDLQRLILLHDAAARPAPEESAYIANLARDLASDAERVAAFYDVPF